MLYLNAQNIVFYLKLLWKPFSIKVLLINFWFKTFWTLGLTFPENGSGDDDDKQLTQKQKIPR